MDTRRADIQTRTTDKRSLTERLDEILQRGFDWVVDNSHTVVGVLVGSLLIGALAAGIYEWIESGRAAAFDALASVGRTFEKSIPVDASGNPTLETANPEIAKKAREDAVVGLDGVIAEYPGSIAASAAALQGARLEIALGRIDAADKRLEQAASNAPDDVARGAVLRLRAYVLEEQGKDEQAAELYAQVGGIEAYPGRIQSYVQAAETYERIGKLAPAIQALESLTSIAPEYAEQADITSQLETLRARAAQGEAPKPAAP